jgi:aminoglycoside phosphotransferase (APT) family kinase protein
MMDWRAALAAYIHSRLPSAEAVEIVGLRGMPAGASNETIGIDLRVSCDGCTYTLPLVLRPQRTGGILAPYDVARQFNVMRALSGTTVPVPAVLWHEPDSAVLGAPFFLMERVAGETLPLFWYGSRTPRLEAAALSLAAIHAVNWSAAGLSFLLPSPGDHPLPPPIECDLAPWRERASHAGLESHPLLIALGGYLTANEPSDARHALIHGDPNPGNYLMRADEVVAVLDWELAAIGDPRADFGFYAALLSTFGGMPGDRGQSLLSSAYEVVTGTPLTALDYYEAVGLYKMAVVMAGWVGRMGGISGFYGMDTISRRLESLLGPRWAG